MSFDTQLRQLFALHREAPALMSPDGQIVTFARLASMVSGFAARLTADGIRPGNCVIPMTDNSVIRAALALALFRLGADVAMPQSIAVLSKAGVSADAVVRFADQAVEGDVRSIIFTQDWLNDAPAPAEAAATESYIIFGTSGSTGLPKLVRFRADRLLHTVQHHVEGSGVSIGPVLVGIPETTMFGFYLMIRAFLQGHGVMWLRGDAATSLAQAERLGVREFMVTPPAIAELTRAAEDGAPRGAVERIVVFGAVSSRELVERVASVFGASIAIKLGSTESGQTSFGVVEPATYVPGWSGYPISTVEVRIVAPSPDGSGRMLIRETPRIGCEGYIGGMPTHDADGWFDSGDVGRVLPDGSLMIVGRVDNLLNLGGSKYAAELIEMLACQLPGVTAAAATLLTTTVAGVPALGLVVTSDADFDADAVRAALALKLRINAPIMIATVERLPVLSTGKLNRHALARHFPV